MLPDFSKNSFPKIVAWQLIKLQNFISLLWVILYCPIDCFKPCFPRKPKNSEIFLYLVPIFILLRQIQYEQQQGIV